MKLSNYVISFLKEEGVDTVFGYQGGAITHLVDSLDRVEGIEFFSMYHEQGAAFAAEGYARIKGDIGVAIATSGPGATNLLTGIGSAFFDSIPCLYLTGQVNTYEYKKSEEVRQAGFQETDIVSVVKPIVKFAKRVTDPERIRYTLEKAVFIARSGRPGPVLIDIPMDIQRAEINEKSLISYYEVEGSGKDGQNQVESQVIQEAIKDIIGDLKVSKRPVALVGGGIRLAKAEKKLSKWIAQTHIPVVTTLMGLDSIDHSKEEFTGFIGAYGNRYANLAVANADLVLVLGSRLSSRQTSPNPETFAREAKIIHIDIDENELGRTIKAEKVLKCELGCFLEIMNHTLEKDSFKWDFSLWLKKIDTYKRAYPSYPTQQELNTIDPNKLMKMISEGMSSTGIICTDVGQNQMWAAQSFCIKEGQRFLTSGGMGAMGFALPTAIGACKAEPEACVIAIAGDGGVQMNIQELQTIIREKLPIKLLIINNKALGMIRHFQEMYFESNYYGTMRGYTTPDFVKIGEAYGIASKPITSYEEVAEIESLLLESQAYLFEIDLKPITYVIPKLSMGRPIEDQDPLIDREELQRHMIIKPLEEK